MVGLGLSCNVAKGRVTVRGVTVEGEKATEVFVYRAADGEDLALHLCSLGNAFQTRLADLSADAVVIRAADHHSAARLTDAAAIRLRAEGVLLATARSRVQIVSCLTGKEIGDACDSSKAEVDAEARALSSTSLAEATAAAFAASRLSQSS